MAYSKINWTNSPSTTTPINATNLNKMDNQIATNETNITTNTSNIATNTNNIATNTDDISALDTRVTTAEESIETLEIANEYSTTEKVVGKWIDGKPLYRKVINFGTLPNTTAKIVSTGLSTSEVTLIKLEGLATGISTGAGGGTSYLLTLPDINPAGPDQATRLSGNSENGIWRVIIQTGVDRTNYSAYISVYYTKTADSAS